MRLIFIPGFGETPRIFDQIAPHLPGEKVFINNLDWLGNQPTSTPTLSNYAQHLIEQYQITSKDIIIGHSMGGWIAYAIKHRVGCPIIQIASWTDPKKVVLAPKNPGLIFWLIRKRWYFNRFTKRLLLSTSYRHQPSAAIFGEVFQNLIDSPPEYVVNQLRLIWGSFESIATIQPDLRIHSVKDSIIRFPDQSVTTVPGDHFNLFIRPQEVITAIKTFLKSPVRSL